MAPDSSYNLLIVSPPLPITNPTQSLGTSIIMASLSGGPYGVVNDKSTSLFPLPSLSFATVFNYSSLIEFLVSSSAKMILSTAWTALKTYCFVSPTIKTC